MTTKAKPLLLEEVPEELRYCLDFSSQYIDIVSKGRKRLTILHKCILCGMLSRVPVSNIRKSLKEYCYTGMCKECNGKRTGVVGTPRFMKPTDLPEHIRTAYDFSSQRLDDSPYGHKQLTIVRTCLSCGEKRRIPVSQLREHRNTNTGLCVTCNNQLPYPVVSGKDHYKWKGGKKIDRKGYVLVRTYHHPNSPKSGYIQEHRLVMEHYLGRSLTPFETVHHKNGNRKDNRIENLELFFTSHGDGQRYKDISNADIQKQIDVLKTLLEDRKTVNNLPMETT